MEVYSRLEQGISWESTEALTIHNSAKAMLKLILKDQVQIGFNKTLTIDEAEHWKNICTGILTVTKELTNGKKEN